VGGWMIWLPVWGRRWRESAVSSREQTPLYHGNPLAGPPLRLFLYFRHTCLKRTQTATYDPWLPAPRDFHYPPVTLALLSLLSAPAPRGASDRQVIRAPSRTFQSYEEKILFFSPPRPDYIPTFVIRTT
jgi:hypothetical protein